jgi:preprotein translocase subunit YajC
MRWLLAAAAMVCVAGPAFAQTKPAQQGPDMMGFFMMMGAIILIMYFLMWRPEQKRQKERQKLIENIKKGDRIITNGGIHGTVGNVKDSTVMVKVAEGVVMEFAKSAVMTVLTAEGAAAAEPVKEIKKA